MGMGMAVNLDLHDLDTVPLERRVLRYYELSEDALRQAASRPEEERPHFVRLGEGWRKLAEETEATLEKLRGLNAR
jgi:hypothetical protein